jgi:CRP-like cAMP-binding protein
MVLSDYGHLLSPDLLRCPFFHILSSREVAALADFAVPERYPRGAAIICPDEDSRSVFVVNEGEVRLFRRSASGREITLRTLPVGAVFGAIFTPQTPADAAASPTALYRLPAGQVQQAINAHPELAAALALFSGWQRELFDRMEAVALHDVAT